MTQDFLKFCRSKPAYEAYNPSNSNSCALAQFGKPLLSHYTCTRYGVPLQVYEAAVHGKGPFTFGALAKRLEALL